MIRKLRGILLLMVVAVGCILSAAAATTPAWEEVNAPVASLAQTMDMDADTEIAVSDGYIYIWSQKAVTVKIFSILGQLISKETIKPGLHRIKLNSRGIFILRAGTTTRRITL